MRCARCHGALSRSRECSDECACLLFGQAPTDDDAAFRPLVVEAPTDDDAAFRPLVVEAPTDDDAAFRPLVVEAPTDDDAALLDRLVGVLEEPMFLRNRA